jgi:hypothetical protein
VKSIRGSVDAYTQVNYKPPMLNDRLGENTFSIKKKSVSFCKKFFSIFFLFASPPVLTSEKLHRRILPEFNVAKENLVAYPD